MQLEKLKVESIQRLAEKLATKPEALEIYKEVIDKVLNDYEVTPYAFHIWVRAFYRGETPSPIDCWAESAKDDLHRPETLECALPLKLIPLLEAEGVSLPKEDPLICPTYEEQEAVEDLVTFFTAALAEDEARILKDRAISHLLKISLDK